MCNKVYFIEMQSDTYFVHEQDDFCVGSTNSQGFASLLLGALVTELVTPGSSLIVGDSDAGDATEPLLKAASCEESSADAVSSSGFAMQSCQMRSGNMLLAVTSACIVTGLPRSLIDFSEMGIGGTILHLVSYSSSSRSVVNTYLDG